MMKSSSFQCKISTNNQLHNKLSQEDEYSGYLRRIDKIVDRHASRDTSPDFYMSFLNKCRVAARNHQSSEDQAKIVLENKHLLDKIIKTRNRKFEIPSETYHLAMHEKRNRELEKINSQNKKIAKRITQQYSTLRKTLTSSNFDPNTTASPSTLEKKSSYACWNYSPLKERKLPKLVTANGIQNTEKSYCEQSQNFETEQQIKL